MKVHSFSESLAKSHMAEDLPLWGEAYARLFPDLQAMHNHRENGDHQKAGIDRSLVLTNSKQILVDEKVRWKAYPDIALEHISARQPNRPDVDGWVRKPLLCDYIAYAIAPLGQCYLLPVPQLQRAWREKGDGWIAKYGERRAENGRYVTLFCPVPVAVVMRSISEAMFTSFAPVASAA